MFLVLLLFALVKKKGYFKCSKHPNNPQDVAAIGNEIVHLKSMMADKRGVEFKVCYFWLGLVEYLSLIVTLTAEVLPVSRGQGVPLHAGLHDQLHPRPQEEQGAEGPDLQTDE